ncbi:hypothetical protein [Mycobacterium sp.]|uniref:hypothetical protein n=1 Tax=Mycobacterium sp. TaxID=1785 RepID=UPI003BB10B9E
MTTESLDQHPVWLQRRDDLLVLQVTFANVTLVNDPAGTSKLTPTDPTKSAQLTICFPPQAILEQAFPPGAPGVGAAPVTNAAAALFANTSQLVFDLPANGPPVEFTATGLLAWTNLISAAASAQLECVWGLVFTPAMGGRDLWLHNPQPDTDAAGVTSLWHSSLLWGDGSGGPDFNSTDPMPLTATASITEVQQLTCLTALDATTRGNIATSSTKVAPLSAREVTLSALGATIDLTGQWAAGRGAGGLAGYRHRAVLGRDEHVTTVQQGFLLPFGFPVKLTQVTQRIGNVLSSDLGAAILTKTSTVVVDNPLMVYNDVAVLPSQGRLFPFRTLRVNERMVSVQPAVIQGVDPTISAVNIPGTDTSVTARYLFHLTAEDYAGNTLDFTAAAYFVPLTDQQGNPVSPSEVATAAGVYDNEQNKQQRPAAGRIGMAIDSPSDTMADITAIYVGAKPSNGGVASGGLAAFPYAAAFDAHIPAIDALSSEVAATQHLSWPEQYIDDGLGTGNPAKIYAQLSQAVPFLPRATGAGGLASLNTPVVGLSQVTGLVGGPGGGAGTGSLGAMANGVFDPKDFFSAAAGAQCPPPLLLGFINLSGIVQGATVGDGTKVPQITTELLYGANQTATPSAPSSPPSGVRTSVTWRPLMAKAGTTVGNFVTTAASALDLNSTTTVSLTGGGQPVTDVRGALSSFNLTFAGGLVTVAFDSLSFASHAGAAPKLDVKIASVTPDLGNALAFFQQLLDNLPGAGNVPQIDYRDNSLVASYSLAVPSIPMGAFLMQNLAVSSSVTLPLDGRPVQASFAFASRDQPFLVTVSLFGGGGFFALTVVSDKVNELEAQLDFGAAASLDLIVASASVAVTAGIYVSFTEGKGWEVDGFFRANGQVDLLGIISVSLEICLTLAYISGPPKRFTGSAEFTLRVQVAFFSQSLSFSVSRSFSAGADPTFDKAFPTAQPWQQHCAAFAPMAGS